MLLTRQRFMGQLQSFAVGGQCQPGTRHCRDQTDLCTAARFGGRQVLLQRLRLEVSQTSEEIELVGGKTQTGGIFAIGISTARGGQGFRDALAASRRVRVNRGKEGAALYLILGTCLFDIERGDSQITIVLQRQFDEVPHPFIDKECTPIQISGRPLPMTSR